MWLDPPRLNTGIHWKALAYLAVAPAAGLLLGLSGPVSAVWLIFAVLFVLPLGAFVSWKYSCYVADTHAQPWGVISFFASMGSWMAGVYLVGAVRGVTL